MCKSYLVVGFKSKEVFTKHISRHKKRVVMIISMEAILVIFHKGRKSMKKLVKGRFVLFG
jgi:hypothetical protein